MLLLPVCVEAQIITTVAGGGTSLGDGGPATAALISNPGGCTIDKNGIFYVTSGTGNRVLKIDTNGIITTIAGTGIGGYTGDSGAATAARLKFPADIVLDTVGNIFIVDFQNNVIRKINASTGIISTICGNGSCGYSGDHGPASAAKLCGPTGICFDKIGNMYIADCNNNCVRKVDTSGIITTIAGTGGTYGFSGDGGPAISAKLRLPNNVQVDSFQNVYITDGNARIRKVDNAGIITTVAGNGGPTYTGGAGMLATSVSFSPEYLKLDRMNNMFVSDEVNNRIFKIDTAGVLSVVAGNGLLGNTGNGGPATAAAIDASAGIALTQCFDLYITNYNIGYIRKVIDTTCQSLTGSLSTSSIPNGSMISVYPNPSTTSIAISASERITSVTISNLLGQTMYSHEYNSTQVQVDVADLPAGVYFVRINGTEVKKFVKQ